MRKALEEERARVVEATAAAARDLEREQAAARERLEGAERRHVDALARLSADHRAELSKAAEEAERRSMGQYRELVDKQLALQQQLTELRVGKEMSEQSLARSRERTRELEARLGEESAEVEDLRNKGDVSAEEYARVLDDFAGQIQGLRESLAKAVSERGDLYRRFVDERAARLAAERQRDGLLEERRGWKARMAGQARQLSRLLDDLRGNKDRLVQSMNDVLAERREVQEEREVLAQREAALVGFLQRCPEASADVLDAYGAAGVGGFGGGGGRMEAGAGMGMGGMGSGMGAGGGGLSLEQQEAQQEAFERQHEAGSKDAMGSSVHQQHGHGPGEQ